MLFTTFYDQGNEIRGLDAAQTVGTPVRRRVDRRGRARSFRRRRSRAASSRATSPIRSTGLPTGNDFAIEPYHSSFSLDAIGQPSLGVVAGGPFGTGVAGGVSMIFGDQLSDRQIFAAIQANGTVKDIGGALQYYNMKNRWNYGGGVEHIPYLTGQVYLKDTALSTPGGPVAAYIDQSDPATRLHRSGRGIHAVSVLDRRKRLEFTAQHHALRLRHASCSRRRSSATRSSTRATRS